MLCYILCIMGSYIEKHLGGANVENRSSRARGPPSHWSFFWYGY